MIFKYGIIVNVRFIYEFKSPMGPPNHVQGIWNRAGGAGKAHWHTYSLSFNLSGINYDRLRHILKDNYNLDKITYLWSEFSPVFSAGRSHISIDTILNVSFNVALE